MQKLAEICVRRPVLATMIILALTVIGAFSYAQLGLDRLPNVDLPVITVTTTNPGGAPEEIEREITDRIEGAVNTVSGIEELRSSSVEGLSQVIIQFRLGKNVDIAAQEVRQKVDLVLRDLPDTADPPVVQKVNSDAAAVLLYAIRGPQSLVDLTEIVDRQIVDRLESVPGVGNIQIYGGRKRQITIRVDPVRLRAFQLTIGEVARALRSQNLDVPGGNLDQANERLTVRTLGKVQTLEGFNDLVVTTRNRQGIQVRDIGFAEDAGADAKSVALQNGQTAIVIAVQKQSGTNTVAVIDALKERLAEIQPSLPSGIKFDIVRDQSVFIKDSLHAIQEHLILGGILAAVVVYLFLRNIRSTIITALAIPTSIIASFALMSALGYTMNLMTMLALTLMVGIVIDDAIVVLENIYKFVEEKGMDPFEAAIEGTREIGLAVMATTLSLLAVFVPIGFMGGLLGKFFSSFGFTSAAAIAVSLIVSFTLTPSLAARWIKPASSSEANLHGTRDGGFYGFIDRAYLRMLDWSMQHRWTIVALCLVVMISIVPLGMITGFSFIPADDENEYEVVVRSGQGASLASHLRLMEEMARSLRENLPGVAATLVVAGYDPQEQPNVGTIFVRLKPSAERKAGQMELIERTRELLKSYPPEIRTSTQAVSPIAGGDRNAAVQFVLAGPDIAELDRYSAELLRRMRANPQIVDPDRSLVPGKPELRLAVNRQSAANLGVEVQDIASTINVLLSGQEVGTFSRGKDQYDIRVRATSETQRDRDALLDATVLSRTGAPVDLRNVVSLEQSNGPGSIDRINRERQVTLYANIPAQGSESEALAAIRQYVEELKLPSGYLPAVTGNSKELEKAGYYFGIAVLLTFVFMYIVLAAQFESFIHPVTILLTLPLSIPFGLLSTALAGQKLNIFSMLGVLLLFGVVKKNAILQIDHTNELRQRGVDRLAAIRQANRDRLRPILMTTIALVAGMIPLIVSGGTAAATNRSIGVLVVGGQSLCLLLTLLAVPVFYSLFEDLKVHPVWARLSAITSRLLNSKRPENSGPSPEPSR